MTFLGYTLAAVFLLAVLRIGWLGLRAAWHTVQKWAYLYELHCRIWGDGALSPLSWWLRENRPFSESRSNSRRAYRRAQPSRERK
jgi:hypothetical protein